MDALIIQTGIKHGRVAELSRSSGDVMSVGRAFDNDLVLTDHHVAPHQARFFRDGEAWRVQVLDNTNPVFLNDRRVTDDSPQVRAGDRVTLGRTRLALLSADQPVDPTRKIFLGNLLARESHGFMIPVLVFLSACLLDMLLTFVEGSTTLNWGEVAYDQILAAVVVILWAGAWALVGRVARHHPHAGLQLITTSAAMLLATLLYFATRYLAYPFHDQVVNEAFGWAALFILLFLLLQFNLLIATNILHVRPVAVVASTAIVALIYAFTWSSESDVDDAELYPVFSSTLVPDPHGGSVSADTYFSTLELQVTAALTEER